MWMMKGRRMFVGNLVGYSLAHILNVWTSERHHAWQLNPYETVEDPKISMAEHGDMICRAAEQR